MHTINISRADFAQKILYLDGKPFTLKHLPYLIPILNCNAEREMLMTGRQVGKSTTLAAEILLEAVSLRHYRSAYIAPRDLQITQFSHDRLSTMIKESPYIQNFIDSSVIQQSHEKGFTTDSSVHLYSCYLTADSIRGYSANSLYIDEIQDILLDNIPIIEECTARKNPIRILYCGTPKTFDNTIQKKWEQTTQHYWAIKCTHCGHWNVPIKEENLGIEFLQCANCKKQIVCTDGEYVALYPERDFVGFHISQAMIAGAPGTGIPWSRLREKVDNPLYGKNKLYNECLGFSYDVGSKLLTESELRQCVDTTMPMNLQRKAEWNMYTVCAGVDWGVLGGNTRTVLTIGGLDKNKNLRVIYAKKFPVDEDPAQQVDNIATIINSAGVSCVCADRGGGVYANGFLKHKLKRASLHEIEYKAKVNAGMQYNKDSQSWITDRTRALAGIIAGIKSNTIIFPAMPFGTEFFPDLLTLSCAYNDRLHCFQILRESTVTDDFAHALTYLRIAAKYITASPREVEYQLDEFIPPDTEQPEDVFPQY